MRWKNGGGETREIAICPEAGDISDFDWRISMARVATEGPFSLFEGVDRTLFLLDGEAMELSLPDNQGASLRPGGAPCSFPADEPVSARLMHGPVTDLNIMTRRGRFSHAAVHLKVEGTAEVINPSSTTALFCRDGTIEVAGSFGKQALGPRDCMLLSPADEDNVTVAGIGGLIVIHLFAAGNLASQRGQE